MKLSKGKCHRGAILVACTCLAMTVDACELEGDPTSRGDGNSGTREGAVCHRTYRNPFLRAHNIGARRGACNNDSKDSGQVFRNTRPIDDAGNQQAGNCERDYRNAFLRARGIGYWTGDCSKAAKVGSQTETLASIDGEDSDTGDEVDCEREHRNAFLSVRHAGQRECAG